MSEPPWQAGPSVGPQVSPAGALTQSPGIGPQDLPGASAMAAAGKDTKRSMGESQSQGGWDVVGGGWGPRPKHAKAAGVEGE